MSPISLGVRIRWRHVRDKQTVEAVPAISNAHKILELDKVLCHEVVTDIRFDNLSLFVPLPLRMMSEKHTINNTSRIPLFSDKISTSIA